MQIKVIVSNAEYLAYEMHEDEFKAEIKKRVEQGGLGEAAVEVEEVILVLTK